jgi:translation initiation factor 4G
MNGFKLILQNLSNLESEYHFVKSNISLYAARAVCDQIISLSDLAQLMKYGAYYPLFFLCMQNMHKLKTPEWLRNQLEKSKINLVDMLPAGDRNKDRLIQILEDRELSFVYPMLKIESTLFEKIQSNLSSKELKEWIESHVDADIRMSIGFIQSLVSCIVKNAAENSLLSDENSETNDNKAGGFNSKVDKLHVAKQKESIEKYQVRGIIKIVFIGII